MSEPQRVLYTTGEIAKLCGVTVRTVQYYDTRGILIPSELSEGGRRLYSEGDLRRMKVICFLRDLGLPINAISQLLAEDDPENVLLLLIDQQEAELKNAMAEHQQKLDKLDELRRELKTAGKISLESIGDIAYQMENSKKLKRVRRIMLAAGIPFTVLECVSIVLWIFKGIWWPFLAWVLVYIPFSIRMAMYYFRRVDFICPECHTVFKPSFKEAVFANHTPSTRKLTCSGCGHNGFCVEVYGGKEND